MWQAAEPFQRRRKRGDDGFACGLPRQRNRYCRWPRMTSHSSVPLGEDLDAIAGQLENLARQLRGDVKATPDGQTAQRHKPVLNRAQCVQLAQRLYADRRRRQLAFSNPDIFGEPAWDILLDLYIAHAEERCISVSSACIGSAAPPTTGLRWLGVLQEEGLVLREHDPQDQRRILVRLSPDGIRRMDDYLSKLTRSGRPVAGEQTQGESPASAMIG